ncbi:MAG: hypothetical protein PVH88_14210 [Ignavibacteria bacterium]|jgi:hypothetical protein
MADISVKTDSELWKIDYAANGFGSWDDTFTSRGDAGAIPVSTDYDGDGMADLSVKVNWNGKWLIDYAYNGYGAWEGPTTSVNIYGDETEHPIIGKSILEKGIV